MVRCKETDAHSERRQGALLAPCSGLVFALIQRLPVIQNVLGHFTIKK
jgi:hypothetical protein